jgi:hypothetical protein
VTRARAIALLNCTAQPLPPEDDPEWAALAELLERDAELQTWFTNQSEADQAGREAVHLLPELHRRTKTGTAKIIRPSATTWNRRRWLAGSAAGVAAAAGGFFYVLERPTAFAHADGNADFAGFREDMARFADRLFRLDKKSEQVAPLIGYLSDLSATTPQDWSQLPTTIAQKSARGCRVIAWGEQKIGLICFYRDPGQVVHLFSVKAAVLKGELGSDTLRQPTLHYGRECTGWRQGDLVHLLVGMKPGTPVADLI